MVSQTYVSSSRLLNDSQSLASSSMVLESGHLSIKGPYFPSFMTWPSSK